MKDSIYIYIYIYMFSGIPFWKASPPIGELGILNKSIVLFLLKLILFVFVFFKETSRRLMKTSSTCLICLMRKILRDSPLQ